MLLYDVRTFLFIKIEAIASVITLTKVKESAKKAQIHKFIKSTRKIIDKKAVHKFELYTSAEAHGERNDYIRYGMNYNNWLNNLKKIMNELPEVEFAVMCAYNALCISSFTDLLKDIDNAFGLSLPSWIGHFINILSPSCVYSKLKLSKSL